MKLEQMYAKAVANASRGLWITKDGRYMAMHEMETSHIRNCISMLNRSKSPFKEPYIKAFEKELAERKEE